MSENRSGIYLERRASLQLLSTEAIKNVRILDTFRSRQIAKVEFMGKK